MFESAIGAAFLTFMITTLIVPWLQPLARRIGLVDRPGGRHAHERATPAVGGLSILLAAAPVGLLVLPLTTQVRGLGLAAVVIMVAGVADDLYRLRWFHRLAAQILAALVIIYVGDIRVDNVGEIFGFPLRPLGPLAIPLTVVATVGVINAVNMADGVDGLAGSVALITSLMLACAALYAGNIRLATGLALVAGALCGFLIFNLRMPWNPRARIFLGNAGSELLGLFIASACFRLTQNGHHPVGVQIAPFLVAPVLIDCLTLMLRRMRMGVSPFMGDRNHLHHMLLDAGVSPNGVVGLIASSTLLIGVLAAIALKAHVPAPYFSGVFVLLWAAYFMATRRRERTVARLKRIFGPIEWMQDREAFATTGVDAPEPEPSA